MLRIAFDFVACSVVDWEQSSSGLRWCDDQESKKNGFCSHFENEENREFEPTGFLMVIYICD